MYRLRFDLPVPNQLVTFVVAGRYLNFTKAAEDLNISRVAVSQQIRMLEEFLGIQLFRRLPRALTLTPDGETYLKVVSQSLEQIATATKNIQSTEKRNGLTVTSTTGFSTYWLVPHIGEFRAMHPDIDLRFLVSDSYLDLRQENVDVAIRYGDGHWKNLDCTFLQRERIFPVCSPTYFKDRPRLVHPDELLGETLLHLEGDYDPQTTWSVWFEGQGVEFDVLQQGISVNTFTNLVQATLDGQGIALIGPPLIMRFLQNGALIRPIDVPETPRRAFYLATPKGAKSQSHGASVFCDWIVDSLGNSRDTPSK